MNFQKEEQLDIEYLEEKANYFDEKISTIPVSSDNSLFSYTHGLNRLLSRTKELIRTVYEINPIYHSGRELSIFGVPEKITDILTRTAKNTVRNVTQKSEKIKDSQIEIALLNTPDDFDINELHHKLWKEKTNCNPELCIQFLSVIRLQIENKNITTIDIPSLNKQLHPYIDFIKNNLASFSPQQLGLIGVTLSKLHTNQQLVQEITYYLLDNPEKLSPNSLRYTFEIINKNNPDFFKPKILNIINHPHVSAEILAVVIENYLYIKRDSILTTKETDNLISDYLYKAENPSLSTLTIALETLAYHSQTSKNTAKRLIEAFISTQCQPKNKFIGRFLECLAIMDIEKEYIDHLFLLADINPPCEYKGISSIQHAAIYYNHNPEHWKQKAVSFKVDETIQNEFTYHPTFKEDVIIDELLRNLEDSSENPPQSVQRNTVFHGFEMDLLIKRDGKIINIEIDGSSHKHRKNRDKMRDKVLEKLGIEVIRIDTQNPLIQ